MKSADGNLTCLGCAVSVRQSDTDDMEKGLFENRRFILDLILLLGVLATLGTAFVGYGRMTEKLDGVDKRLSRIEDRLFGPVASMFLGQTIKPAEKP